MVRQALKIIIIAGPTASGKSAYALELAEKIDGEVVCADSRQVYKHMRIGTAGPTDEELARVKHWGYHIIDPKGSQKFDAAKFVKLADKYVAEINSRNKTAILVGGTGLYLKAFRFGLTEQIDKDQLIRDRLDQEVKELGLDNLYERLKQIDPASLDNIKSNDKIRITRALEIYEITKKKPSELRQNFENTEQNIRVKADWHLIMPEREVLLKRLELRAELMFEQGLVEEAVYLKEYLGADHPLCKTMGYEEAIKLASGELTEQEALEKVIIRQRQYAKRQKTWFQKEDWWEHAV